MTPTLSQREHIDTILETLRHPGAEGEAAIIERSWRRCIDRYGLDPARPTPARYVPGPTLREHQDQADALGVVGLLDGAGLRRGGGGERGAHRRPADGQ